jgi:DNA helicase IV
VDKVYSEEKERLDYVIRTVNNEISELETSMPFPGVHLYSTGYDRDERENLFYQKSVNSKHYEKIKYYHEFKDSPYFARMDFNVKENQMSDYVTMYIGKKSLNIDNEYLVYDWRVQ